MRVARLPLPALTALLVGAVSAASLAILGPSEEAVRSVVRWTARIAVVFFCAAFSASSLRALWPAPWTRWLVRERRRLGLAFATAHGLHALALLTLALAFPSPFLDELNAVTLVGGGITYLFIAAMAITSTDNAVRGMGRKLWKRFHTVGGAVIWLVFAQSYLPRAAEQPAVYALPATLLLGSLGLRVAKRLRSGATLPAATT